MIKIFKFKARLFSNMDVSLFSYELCYKTGTFWKIWPIEDSGGGIEHVLQFLNFQRILYSIVRPPCSNFLRLAAPLVMIIVKAELDLEYNRLLITKGLEHCFVSL